MTYIQFSLTIILLHNQEVFWKPIKSSFATYSLIEADQILTWNHQLLIWFLCSIHWINWIQKLKLKIYFFVDISTFLYTLNQRPDQYKMKILVFSIQYDFQILKYQYQYSIWRILNKYQYQYAKKTEVSVFSISILSGKKKENKQTKQIWKI